MSDSGAIIRPGQLVMQSHLKVLAHRNTFGERHQNIAIGNPRIARDTVGDFLVGHPYPIAIVSDLIISGECGLGIPLPESGSMIQEKAYHGFIGTTPHG